MTQMSIQDAIELAKRAQQSGELSLAQVIYQQVLAAFPEHPDALHLLGLVEFQLGRMDRAQELIGQAIRLAPGAAHFQANLGLVLAGMGKWMEAIAAYERALEMHANFPAAQNALGRVLAQYGETLHQSGELESAAATYRRALSYLPDLPEVQNNLGAVLIELGRAEESVGACRSAIKLRADLPEAWNNLGSALRDSKRFDEAINAYETAERIRPNWADPGFDRGAVMLLRGQMPAGWKLLESRWHDPAMAELARHFSKPVWDGSELHGKTILLHAEQGFGDAIQFIRYVPMVAARGGKVIVARPRELDRLFRQIKGVEQWVTPGDRMPAYDVHCSLMSLPMNFGTKLATIPAHVPYLSADPELVDPWKGRLSDVGAGRKVGLVWSGRPTHRRDRMRSLPLATLDPLSKLSSIRFVALQPGVPGAPWMVDLTQHIQDFADTAGLISQLDLVITADTAVAHLAGAMGRPVWVMLPFMPDWRWMLDRSDSPWYPMMRLFRQERAGDWAGVIGRVAGELMDHQGRIPTQRATID